MIDNLKINGLLPAGRYSLEASRWYKCRENFALVFNSNTKGFFFSKSGDVESFVNKTEDLIGIVGRQYPYKMTLFEDTADPDIVWVKLSSFWKECSLRRSFFTILLRAGNNYSEDLDNYEEALFSEKYFNETRYAVMRFLFGFTEYKYDNSDDTFEHAKIGWRDTFYGMAKSQVRNSLLYPQWEERNKFILGTDSLRC